MRRKVLCGLFVLSIGYAELWGKEQYQIPGSDSQVKSPPNLTILEELEAGMTSIAENANEALVFVSVSKTLKNLPQGFIDPFDLFGFGPQRRMPNDHPHKQEGLGSGFFIDLKKGYILTNNHVIEGADEISLKLANGKKYSGKVLGRDENTDIAVVAVMDENFERQGLSELVLGDSDKIKMGSIAMALGAPFGLEASISFGVVSAVGRGSLNLTKLGNFIQTDAAINPGNSGGPLLGVDGRVIGINTAIYSKSGGYAGVGFAVPANLVRQVASSLINDGTVARGYIGVALHPLQPEWLSNLNLPKETTGVIVSEVVKGGPAEKAGVSQFDIITEVDGKAIKAGDELVNSIGLKKPGEKVNIGIFRDGKKRSLTVTVASYPGTLQLAQNKGSVRAQDGVYGLVLEPMSEDLKQRYKFNSDQGIVVVDVKKDSVADQADLREGDVIVKVNRSSVKSEAEFKKILDTNASKQVLLFIERYDEMSKQRGFYVVPFEYK